LRGVFFFERSPKLFKKEDRMTRLVLLTLLVLGFGMAPAQPGPCTSEILRVEKAVSEPNSPYTPTARQSIGAQTGRQPTPSSVAQAEEKADAAYKVALDRARALDSQDNPDCAQAVKELKEVVGMP
jgi:hypothetical protein